MKLTPRSRLLALVAVVIVLVAAAAGALWRTNRPAPVTAPAPAPAALALPAGAYVMAELDGWAGWPMAESLGGTFVYVTGPQAAADDPLSEFKFLQAPDRWFGNGAAVAFGQVYADFSASGGNSSFAHTAGSVYAFKWDGGARAALFKLAGLPAAIRAVDAPTPSRLSPGALSVAATTDLPLPAGQALWLRYAVNGDWAASQVVKMTGSGTRYTAAIPAQPAAAEVSYYVFSSSDVAAIAPADADLMTINANTNAGVNYRYTVAAKPAAGPIPLSGAKAFWLDADTVAWSGAADSTYRLLYDPDGKVEVEAEDKACTFPEPAGPCYVALKPDGMVSGYAKNPNATGLTRLRTGLAADDVRFLLRGEVAVAKYQADGRRLDATRLQIQGVLDDLYAAAATPQALGPTYTSTSTSALTLKLWAPTAKSVTLRRYATSSGPEAGSEPMTLDPASGVWAVRGDASWDRQFYLFDVEVYVPAEDRVAHNLVTDPYAISLSQDGSATGDVRSQFVNLADPDLKPAGWDALTKPALAAPEDIVIYEMHVRDFSINDLTVAPADRGAYRAFTYDGAGPAPNAALSDGMAHLLALKDAGLTHVHLLPAFDIASVVEPAAERTEPIVPDAGRDSAEQQAAVAAARGNDGFNWGYDPYHYGVPEGSYSTDPDGPARILEFRELVSALNRNGLRVVLDVVYNHTSASGQDDHSVLDKIVPGYYHRYDASGNLYTSSCCADTATEYALMEKLMTDTVVRFAADYKVDGFRFDLMNLHTRRNMEHVQAAVTAVEPTIYLYGEGWDFGSARDKGLTACPDCYAKQNNMTGSGIGAFNDKIRDAAHGGYNTDPVQIRRQGFINGLSYDWNGYEYAGRDRTDLWAATETLRAALAGSAAFFAADPQETINYVEKHDNETLFDQNVFKLPNGDGKGNPGWIGVRIPATAMADRVRSQNLGASIVGLAQGVPFFQMGQDLLRSKSLDRNSYDSGDWFNRVWWDGSRNNFGVGLPPAWDNDTRWGIMRPLLADERLSPAAADLAASAAHFREVLRLRRSSPLFRLPTQAEIERRVWFYNTDNAQDALIVMALSDAPDPDLDAQYETILVFFNANKKEQTIAIPGAASFTLHPIQADATDADPVVQTARFDAAAGAFTIPARTAAVFVSAQALQKPQPASSVDWVGDMSPAGGVANRVQQGEAGDFAVYVQLYERDATEAPGENTAGITCYLHWGSYSGGPWTDTPMTWHAQRGNNDEYVATLTRAQLDALPPGAYGFTAYCRRPGETEKWQQDGKGDGLLTLLPPLAGAGSPRPSAPAPAGGVFVHLFEWRWADIEKECAFLAEKGYAAVQVSPPNEHVVPTADMGGVATNDFPWWVRYQPVTHDVSKFTSRSGTWAEFKRMVEACQRQGVGIYVDAVINHMAAMEVGTPPRGTAGTEYNAYPAAERFYGTQYQADDFHPDCPIQSYGDRTQVQSCALASLPDLNTGKPDVQAEIRGYLQALLDAGVAGFRIDAGKHMAAGDVAAILRKAQQGASDGLRGDFYAFLEVIDQSSAEPIRDWEYAAVADVTEFAYSAALGQAFDEGCRGSLSDLENRFAQPDMLPAAFAQVFADNHDNQRGHGSGAECLVDHRDGQVHVLANIFALAYPYGYPSVMSSYYWQSNPRDNSGDSLGPPSTNDGGATWGPGLGAETRPVYGASQKAGDAPANCSPTFEPGKWTCEHRRTAVANMVAFRRATAGQPVTNWQNIGAAPTDHIAFGLGDVGFVAINRTAAAATTTYATALPDGVYCDVIHYDFVPATGRCVVPGTAQDAPADRLIAVRGGRITATVPALDAFAIYAAAAVR